MHLVTFEDAHGVRPGLLSGNQVVDVFKSSPDFPDMLSVIRAGKDAASVVEKGRDYATRIQLADIRLLAPIPKPARNIFCVGKNYHAHAREFYKSGFDPASQSEVPGFPIVFTKAPSSVIGTGHSVLGSLDFTSSLDYEGELAVVIGRGGRGINRKEAMGHVFGYTIVNDITSRVLQRQHGQWFIGKSADTFCPMGPSIVTTDEIPDPSRLRIELSVNDETRQNACLADLIFDIPELIATLSRSMTLECGDIIATGTPEGVGIGYDPPKFLKSGDTVIVSIAPIGNLVNTIQ